MKFCNKIFFLVISPQKTGQGTFLLQEAVCAKYRQDGQQERHHYALIERLLRSGVHDLAGHAIAPIFKR